MYLGPLSASEVVDETMRYVEFQTYVSKKTFSFSCSNLPSVEISTRDIILTDSTVVYQTNFEPVLELQTTKNTNDEPAEILR